MITFNIPGSGVQNILVSTPLPAITSPVIINGTSQPGFEGAPIIRITRFSPSVAGDGLTITAGNSEVRGLIINGFAGQGILLQTGGNNVIQGNYIGTDSTGSGAAGNGGDGVRILNSASNLIGGDTSLNQDNIIAFNGNAGVSVISGSQNRITGNSVFSNGAPGIDLSPSGVTPNDPCDGDTGANNLQNFPLLTSAVISETSVTISGMLDSAPLGNYTIEFFANSACDPSGNGEGGQFIGSTSVSTSMACTASFSVGFPPLPGGSSFITATATDSMGNTSEFSPCIMATVGTASADLSISKNDSPDPVLSGSQITYTIVVTNNGPDVASQVTVTDVIPSGGGYTFASVMSSQGSCATPPPGGTGTVTCSPGTINSEAMVTITLVVNVTAPPGSTITNTTFASSNVTPDPNSANNSATTTTTVASTSACVINCPANVTVDTLPARCGAIVRYSAPTTSGSCATIICSPQSGSFFPVGTTTVTCSEVSPPAIPAALALAACSFTVTVVDNVAPRITCPENISATPDQGQRSKVVTYPSPVVIDNCSVFSVNCSPPSGASFPTGTTAVTCIATDIANNVATCSFTVTVTDTQPPTIVCPGNVVVQATGGQCSAVVNFPSPNLSGSPEGTGVVCVPPSGATFPAGTTAITCTATTPAGLRATCGFSVTVNGPPQSVVVLEGNKSALEFGPTQPVRKSKKNPPRSCDCSETFTIENTGCGVLGLDLASIMRTGSDVESGRITDPDDRSFYTVTIVNPDGTETPATCAAGVSPCIRINPGQKLTFRVVFKPIIPAAFSGKTRGLAASEVLPERITSKITFNQSGGGAPLVINLVGRISSTLRLIDPESPRKPKRVIFERSGNEFTVTYAVYDSNLDVTRTRFEFLDDQGRQVGQAIEVDLAGPVRESTLVRGQSFVVVQRFTGALDNPEATSVRVTVFDPESSDTATGALSSSSRAASIESQSRSHGVLLFPPRSRLAP
jgi:uncharacterized repeat protein (TIGR01451 family)